MVKKLVQWGSAVLTAGGTMLIVALGGDVDSKNSPVMFYTKMGLGSLLSLGVGRATYVGAGMAYESLKEKLDGRNEYIIRLPLNKTKRYTVEKDLQRLYEKEQTINSQSAGKIREDDMTLNPDAVTDTHLSRYRGILLEELLNKGRIDTSKIASDLLDETPREFDCRLYNQAVSEVKQNLAQLV